MAGFQQAANALTGAYGAVAGRVGIYNELVGKNKELIEELGSKNEELEKKNKELTKKNKELEKKDKTINYQKESMAVGDELLAHYTKGSLNLYMRNMEHERARASRDLMMDAVYGEKSTGDPTRDLAKEELKREREKLNGGGK